MTSLDDQKPRWWRDARRRRLLLATDILVGSFLGLAVVGVQGEPLVLALIAAVLAPVLAKLLGLYDADHRAIRHLTLDELPALAAWSFGVTALTNLVTSAGLDAPKTLVIVACGLMLALSARSAARYLWRRTTPLERTVVLGEGEPARAIARKIELFEDLHLRLCGIEAPTELAGDRDSDELEAFGRALRGIDRIVLAWNEADPALIERLTEVCRRQQIKFSVVSPFRGKARPALVVSQVAELPVLEYNTWDVPRSTLAMKRAVDVVLASFALVLSAPLFACIAVAIWVGDRGSVIYRQERAGKDGKSFQMLKFRSMWADAHERRHEYVDLDALEEPMFKLVADPRVTRVGTFIRRYSLDELPQLLNVLRGDMSMVGPRPEETDIVTRYRPEHSFRLSVKPGLTGPMQVFGRGHLTFQERLAVELDYVENLSIPRDLRILMLTFPAVIHGRGAL